ncbi:MAG: Gfo/Idh/MocA family oxidoreductase [Planctomycetota bacterium]|nr:Gfo/Idh/MocA family oxidoreductase [Planctomycetota bacterium]
MAKKVRIAFLSFAHMHANGYAGELRALPKGSVEIAGIWDRDAARAKKMAKLLGTKAYAKREQLLARKPDGAIVCSENVLHKEDVLAAAEAGCGVLCEKPLAPTVADCRAMIDGCAKAGVPLMTAFPCRFLGTLMRLKERVDGGELGQVLAVSATNHGRQPGGWFADPKRSGGGAVMDHTVHVADLLRWLLKQEFTRVYAAAGFNRFALTRKAVGKRAVDDAGLLSLEMSGGTVAALDCSWSRPAEYPTWGDVKLELIGAQAVARLDAFRQRALLASKRTGKQVELFWGDQAQGGLGGAFVKVLAEGLAPPITGEDGLRATEVVEAAYRSIRDGSPVVLAG